MVIDVHCHIDIGAIPISLNIEYTAPVSISMFIIFFNIVHIINAGGVNMDNLNATATGGSLGDDNTGFVTPSFMDGFNTQPLQPHFLTTNSLLCFTNIQTTQNNTNTHPPDQYCY